MLIVNERKTIKSAEKITSARERQSKDMKVINTFLSSFIAAALCTLQ